MDLSLVPMLLKSWDYLMGKCLVQHLDLQMESHLELMKELSWVLQMDPKGKEYFTDWLASKHDSGIMTEATA